MLIIAAIRKIVNMPQLKEILESLHTRSPKTNEWIDTVLKKELSKIGKVTKVKPTNAAQKKAVEEGKTLIKITLTDEQIQELKEIVNKVKINKLFTLSYQEVLNYKLPKPKPKTKNEPEPENIKKPKIEWRKVPDPLAKSLTGNKIIQPTEKYSTMQCFVLFDNEEPKAFIQNTSGLIISIRGLKNKPFPKTYLKYLKEFLETHKSGIEYSGSGYIGNYFYDGNIFDINKLPAVLSIDSLRLTSDVINLPSVKAKDIILQANTVIVENIEARDIQLVGKSIVSKNIKSESLTLSQATLLQGKIKSERVSVHNVKLNGLNNIECYELYIKDSEIKEINVKTGSAILTRTTVGKANFGGIKPQLINSKIGN